MNDRPDSTAHAAATVGEEAIPAAALARARQAAAGGRPLLDALEDELGLPPQEFLRRLGNAARLPVASMERLHALTPQFDLLPFPESVQRECILFREESGELLLVTADPFAGHLREWAEQRVRRSFAVALAHRADIQAYLTRHEETVRAMDDMVGAQDGAIPEGARAEDLSLLSISADTSPVVKLVRSTLYDALKVGASDIHLETSPAGLTVKYRVDGVLSAVGTAAGLQFAEQVVSRIKVMSDLDISERRVPQDGRFKVMVRDREIDFRVSVMPSIFGEDAVLRILDKQALSDQVRGLRLDYLGFEPETMRVIRRLAAEPYGMLLVTGPTGSGKTTTLYAAISEINTGRDKIITIEDPVEYQLPGVLQIPVNERKGLTFARGLRSILRHDPDKILVGEIRDPETAQIAIQAALTGHLVFTSVHANSVLDVIGRFTHMGVDPFSFVGALSGTVAQRLVRLNCPGCTEPHPPEAALVAASGLSSEEAAGFDFRAGRGCGLCRGAGYKGRRAIAELLVMNDELRELIAGRASLRQIKDAARRNGMRFLREGALALARRGETTLEEINRVTVVG